MFPLSDWHGSVSRVIAKPVLFVGVGLFHWGSGESAYVLRHLSFQPEKSWSRRPLTWNPVSAAKADNVTDLLCGMLGVLRGHRALPVRAQKGSPEEAPSEQSLEERADLLG